ncbi:MAG: hypothetical protein HOL17_10000 [Gammaproteobacteria bacterium]|jgi:phage terminase Nu1 subunit (DNA packaging protein)|nr:hypothetical protein [Gammaproteobacteria bacterium]MBT6479559.1 hypothetical protein [Gammaproteobacteria bacterium]
MVIADAARQIVSVLDALPQNLKRKSGNLNARDMEVVQEEVARARNVAATIKVDLDKLLGDE